MTKNILLSIFGVLALTSMSILTWVFSYRNELVFLYNDAMSHLNIARLVLDNQQPGIAQLGSVWLPLNHILPLIFVWNDWAYRTGLAASVFSMASYVVTGVLIYKILKIVTNNKLAGFVGAFAFATNLNILYLQTTPLTEPLFVCLFTLSVYLFTRFLTEAENGKYLPLMGVVGFLQLFTRYDGWFVVVIQGLLIGIYELAIQKENIKNIFGKLFLYGSPILFGVSLWLLWNLLIFKDPFFFALGQYSSHAQEVKIEQGGGLLSKGNIMHASLAYTYAVIHNIGEWVLGYALIGLAAFLLYVKRYLPTDKKILLVILLFSPILFNVISMYLGFSTVQIPELYGNPQTNVVDQWFNVRFGIVALPFAAIFIGILATWQKLAPAICVLAIIFQSMLMFKNGVITLADGIYGVSAFRFNGPSNVLNIVVKPEETVLMSMAYFNPIAFRSNIKLNQIIHEGVKDRWPSALNDPEFAADYIVMGENVNAEDPVRKAVFDTPELSEKYRLIYIDKEVSIYNLKQSDVISFNDLSR